MAPRRLFLAQTHWAFANRRHFAYHQSQSITINRFGITKGVSTRPRRVRPTNQFSTNLNEGYLEGTRKNQRLQLTENKGAKMVEAGGVEPNRLVDITQLTDFRKS
jgi:hypothetical protein